MTLREQIIETYPELADAPSLLDCGIVLQDDSDGSPVFIADWNYSKPIPNGLKVGK
jgi:hypothetical protein